MKTDNIHATAVSINNHAILLLGQSGAGKSDLALRLIKNKNAVLIADDRVDLFVENGVFKASCPQNIQGLIEIRGVGICKLPFVLSVPVKMAIQLVSSYKEQERIPQAHKITFSDVEIPLYKLYPFEVSATDKVVMLCDQIK